MIECRSGEWELLTARCLLFKAPYFNVKRFNNAIVEFDSKEQHYQIGDVIKYKNNELKTKFNISEIHETNEKQLVITHEERTISSYFIMPILGINANYYSWNKYFINCKVDPEKNIIHLIYRFMPTSAFDELDKKLSTHMYYIEQCDIDDSLMVFSFKAPDGFVDVWKNFKDGKYSLFSNDYKKTILKFHVLTRDGLFGQILYKDTKRKTKLENELGCSIPNDIDLFSKPNLKLECLTLN